MKRIALAFLLFAIFLFLAFNKHSKDDYRSYRSVLWADASGYYIYNPMWFIYGNECHNLPDSITAKTGTGFSLDTLNNRIITKYTSGVAILQMPFFLAAHTLAGPLGYPADGFSPVYHGAIMISGAFYGLLGLFFSFYFLRKFYSLNISLISVSAFFLCTNLFYYALDASGFLHIYSFFLISVIAFLTVHAKENPRFRNFLLLFLAFAIAVLIRPTNIILLIFLFLFSNTSGLSFIKTHLKNILLPALISLMVLIPQMIYWSQSFGKPLVYSYGEEGFPFLLSPKFILVWFSTNNGLFTWAPVLFVSLIGMVISFFRKDRNGTVVAIIFLLASYIFSSWWNYWFGCAMGARSFVEYYPLFMFTFALTISRLKNKLAWGLLFSFLAVCLWANMNIIYYYDGCFYGGEWDWNIFFNLLTD